MRGAPARAFLPHLDSDLSIRSLKFVELDYRRFSILAVDDEPDILRAFVLSYRSDFEILTADGGEAALEMLGRCDPAVIVADQRMPGMPGTEFLERSLDVRPDAMRIVLTGYSDLGAIIRAINNGRIFQYVTKPWQTDELRLALRRAVEMFHLGRERVRLLEELRQANQRLEAENEYLRMAAAAATTEIVGQSPAMQRLTELIGKVAPSRSTVLIQGETGTGKELVARAVHAASPRRERLFVAVNCAELSEGILESELFGHRRGAFTGAQADRKGLFEVADGGTLFLDEIGEITPSLQAKLLRVLQEGEIRPVGDARPRKVDTRVIVATNRDLGSEVQAGRFRSDLFYRLNVFPIKTPPLRERREDIPPLARHFLARHAVAMQKPVGELTREAMNALSLYAFPGNVRELSNEIERAILLADQGAPISEDLLSDHVLEGPGAEAARGAPLLASQTNEFEREQIAAAMERNGGVKMRVAEELGLSYKGLLKKMKRLGM